MRYVWLLLLSLLASIAAMAQPPAPSDPFASRMAALEASHGGRLGVAVIRTDGTPVFAYRADERFAMCSTFKALLAAQVLSRVDAHRETLDRPIHYDASAVLAWAPVTKEHLAEGSMTVSELTAAAIQHSDNTAANLLLDAVGGPEALTSYLRAIGDATTRLDRNETSLNTNAPGDPRDSTTPRAMAATLRTILVGEVLLPASRERLKQWMIGNTTGDARLRAGFDGAWIVGDKTGSGGNGATNDVAIVFPTKRKPFIIAVYYSESTASDDDRNAVLAEVARITRAMLAPGPHR